MGFPSLFRLKTKDSLQKSGIRNRKNHAMIKPLLTAICLLAGTAAMAQLSHGGQPRNWEIKSTPEHIRFERIGAIDPERLALEDAITDQHKDVPYRFGVEFETNFNINNSGVITSDESTETTTWTIGLECPGALSMSIRFDEFIVPKGGQVFIWSADRREFLGAFNHKNMKPSGVLACGLVHGDKIVVEYNCPTHLFDQTELTIGEVVHTYRPFATSRYVQDAVEAMRGPFGNSGACNVGVNCPEAAEWQVEKRSVAIIVEGGSGVCTGALVNNTANDGTPYFLTANHCTSGANTANWVFYFNHEATSCTGNNGPTTNLISGADLLANRAGSDFALLLLNDTPPASYNVQYAGWDATDSESAVSSAVCIHHPSGNVKKFSQEDDAPYHDVSGGAQVWWIDNWEIGITEPGSSGSPLFNQDHRIIGQLFGGASACNGNVGNGQYDFYGRFGVSWDAGTTSSTRLVNWLDPLQSGTLVLDGYPEGFTLPGLDAQSGGISNIAANNCGDQISPVFTLVNQGTATLELCNINYQLNNGSLSTIEWNGSLSTNQTAAINLPQMTAANGANTLVVTITNVNGNANDDVSTNNSSSIAFNAISGIATTISVSITLDDYPEETSWDIQNASGVVIAQGSGYTGGIVASEVCVAPGCYEFTIYDEYGDGLCCDWGTGSYAVTSANGEILAEGATFTDLETTSVCTNTVSVNEVNGNQVMVYPNPANDFIQLQAAYSIVGAHMYDATGRLVLSELNLGSTANLNIEKLGAGMYELQVVTTNGNFHQKVIVNQ
jgi:lysyl endopeptidase